MEVFKELEAAINTLFIDVEEIKRLFAEKGNLLDENEKNKFLLLIADRGSSADCDLFLAFCDAAEITFSVDEAKTFSELLFENCKRYAFDDRVQTGASDFIFKMAGIIDDGDVNEYLAYMVELAIKSDCICALQDLLTKDKELHFITKGLKDLEPLLSEQPDMRIAENVRCYFETGMISESWMNFVDGIYEIYEADTYENRAAEEEYQKRNYQIPGIRNHRCCIMEKIDDSHYKYSGFNAYVNIIKNEDGTWYYTRLNNISRSVNFGTLQECIDVACEDMLRAKL